MEEATVLGQCSLWRRAKLQQRVRQDARGVRPAPATIPEEDEFMLLRGKGVSLNHAACDVSADSLAALAAAWPATAAALLGDAYDSTAHAWKPERAIQYRSLRWRRGGVADASVQGHRTAVVSILTTAP